MPDFNFSDLQVHLEQRLQEDSSFIEEGITLSFRANGVLYSHSFFQGLRDSTGKTLSINSWAEVSAEFHKGINRYLTDKGASYRLFVAQKRERYSNDNLYMGLILLTESQRKAWGKSAAFLSDESFDTRFTTKNVEKLAADYEQLGLFSHLSQLELAEGRKKLAS